ncbi:NADAR family protein [Dyadobacter sandarakinus]|uniref:NADAR family protein n=1 Tax=Dyadobacter sandarakinus TaxID=2747268 RepID=A0ABX7IAE7_9BACT|nr:NADAR family protein [Dyadobacter sandarakinus]QRR03092.1 NADAR family protein [Dyadobacter sandarakinus]
MKSKYNLNWLIQQERNGAALKYLLFWSHIRRHGEEIGKYCFSQWFELPFAVDGVTYLTSEHWMMAAKAQLFGDLKTYEQIIRAEKPGAAKELGRLVMHFDEKVWERERFRIVVEGNVQKFGQNPAYADFLVKTGNRILVEASPRDPVWGIGLAEDDENARDPERWPGLNLLGFALMEARDILRNQ